MGILDEIFNRKKSSNDAKPFTESEQKRVAKHVADIQKGRGLIIVVDVNSIEEDYTKAEGIFQVRNLEHKEAIHILLNSIADNMPLEEIISIGIQGKIQSGQRLTDTEARIGAILARKELDKKSPKELLRMLNRVEEVLGDKKSSTDDILRSMKVEKKKAKKVTKKKK